MNLVWKISYSCYYEAHLIIYFINEVFKTFRVFDYFIKYMQFFASHTLCSYRGESHVVALRY